jgi:hypothetical protein
MRIMVAVFGNGSIFVGTALRTRTFKASAFFLSSLWPPTAAFFFPLKTCSFIRVGGISDMVGGFFAVACLPVWTTARIQNERQSRVASHARQIAVGFTTIESDPMSVCVSNEES